MKRMIVTLVAVLTVSVGSLMAQSDNGFIGKARGAAHDCVNAYKSSDGWIVEANVYTVSSCFAGGFITEVTFTARPEPRPCPEGAFCHPPALPIIIAQVRFGCEGELISNSCY